MRWAACALVLAGCQRCAPEAPKALILGTTTEPKTLDPAFADTSGAQEIVRLLFRDLTEFDDSWEVQPSLAAALPRVETSSVGLIARWTLRPKLRWADGAPLTSKDVEFGFEVERDPRLATVSHSTALRVQKLAATDSESFEVQWIGSSPDYAAPRVHAILPAHFYPQGREPGFLGMGRLPLASGPYQLGAWRPGEMLELKANPFWQPAPAIDRIVFRFFPSDETFHAALAIGGIDALGEASGLDLEHAAALEDLPRHQVFYRDGGGLVLLLPRCDQPPFDSYEIRSALSGAIDRSVLARLAYGGKAKPATGIFAPRHRAHRDRPIPSQRALPQAEVVLQFTSGSRPAERIAAYLADRLGPLGLKLHLEGLPFSVLNQRLAERTQAPLVVYALRTRPDWDGRALVGQNGRLNFGGCTDPTIDALLTQAAQEPDPARWAQNLADLDQRVADTLPVIPLVFKQEASVAPRDLEGWRPTGTTAPVTWNAETWRRSAQGPLPDAASAP